jgi:polyisoprenoid-binding protein YceI
VYVATPKIAITTASQSRGPDQRRSTAADIGAVDRFDAPVGILNRACVGTPGRERTYLCGPDACPCRSRKGRKTGIGTVRPEHFAQDPSKGTCMLSRTVALLSLAIFSTFAVVGIAATQDTKSAAPAAATAPKSDASGSYKIDDVHSSAFFRVMHAGAGQFWGRFNNLSGSMSFDAAGAPTGFDISIAIDSVDTANEKLDGHLKSPDFFNAAEFPAMTFKSSGVKKLENGMYEVTGDLTMHGVTKQVAAMIEVTGLSNMMGKRAGVEATFSVKRSEFGMNYGVEKGVLGDTTRVLVNLEGVAG